MECTATCSCGQLTVRCAGDPISVSLCHCLACQKRTGSTYGIAAFLHATGCMQAARRGATRGPRIADSTSLSGSARIAGRRSCGSRAANPRRSPSLWGPSLTRRFHPVEGRLRRTPPPVGGDDDLRPINSGGTGWWGRSKMVVSGDKGAVRLRRSAAGR